MSTGPFCRFRVSRSPRVQGVGVGVARPAKRHPIFSHRKDPFLWHKSIDMIYTSILQLIFGMHDSPCHRRNPSAPPKNVAPVKIHTFGRWRCIKQPSVSSLLIPPDLESWTSIASPSFTSSYGAWLLWYDCRRVHVAFRQALRLLVHGVYYFPLL